jgi:antirestriction factor ArdC-like protein
MKTRRQPTEAQRAAAAERRERFKALAARVAAMSEDERTGLVIRLGAIVTCEGHALSAFNSCLVLTQLPTASMVGGFHQWRAKGRMVRKGEHGLMIWIPTGRKDKDSDAAPTSEDASAGENKRSGFVMGYVFDVTQTEALLDGPELYRRAADACAASGQ